jgi:hypothetical protein
MVKGCVLDSFDSWYVPVAGRVEGDIVYYRAAVWNLEERHVTATAMRMLAVCVTLLLSGHASRSVETET